MTDYRCANNLPEIPMTFGNTWVIQSINFTSACYRSTWHANRLKSNQFHPTQDSTSYLRRAETGSLSVTILLLLRMRAETSRFSESDSSRIPKVRTDESDRTCLSRRGRFPEARDLDDTLPTLFSGSQWCASVLPCPLRFAMVLFNVEEIGKKTRINRETSMFGRSTRACCRQHARLEEKKSKDRWEINVSSSMRHI